jgi:hypothetical protein
MVFSGLTQNSSVETSDVRNIRNFHRLVAALGQYSEHTRIVASGDGGKATRLIAEDQQSSPTLEGQAACTCAQQCLIIVSRGVSKARTSSLALASSARRTLSLSTDGVSPELTMRFKMLGTASGLHGRVAVATSTNGLISETAMLFVCVGRITENRMILTSVRCSYH